MIKKRILLLEGLSWPGGLESGRFSALSLPSSEEDIAAHLLNAFAVDDDERSVVEQWAASGDAKPPADEHGILGRVVLSETEGDLDGLACLARSVSAGHHPTVTDFILRDRADVGEQVRLLATTP